MPVMGGIEATQKIRLLEKEMQSPSPIPIVGITANARSEQLKQVMEAGMVLQSCHVFALRLLIVPRTKSSPSRSALWTCLSN
jgi:CheY-like chemotaxis protein